MVFTTPLLSALRRHQPQAHLTYVVEPGAAEIVRGNPNIDELILAPRRQGLQRVQDDVALARRLHGNRYSVAIDLHGGPRSAFLAWASRAPRRIGYNITGRSWMYTDVVPRARQLTPRHSVMNQWDLLQPLGVPPIDPAQDPVHMPDDARAALRADAHLNEMAVGPEHVLIVIHVSASTRFKRWPEDSFVSLVTALIEHDPARRVFLTSGPSDAEAAQRIADIARTRLGAMAKAVLKSHHFNLTELRAVIARAGVYVGGDSGPLHIAATTTVPIVELLGPTLAERSYPWRDPRWFSEIVDPGALPCRPCHQRTCVPGDFRCLTGIGYERVLAATERALASRSGRDQEGASTTNERRIPLVHG